MIDLHTHSHFSDGTLDPVRLARCAVTVGLTAFAITDHDTFAGYDYLVAMDLNLRLDLICGIELTAHYDDACVHVLAYFLNEDPGPQFRTWVRTIQQVRHARNIRIIENLRWHGCGVTLEGLPSQRVIGRPYIAAQLVRKGYAASIPDAFTRYLGESAPCYEKGAYPTVEDVLEKVSRAGGVPVLAHPGRYPIDNLALDSMLQRTIDRGLKGIEVFHSEHSAHQSFDYRDMAIHYNLSITGGSDFHGESKPSIRLGRGINANLHVRDSVLSVLRLHSNRRSPYQKQVVSAVVNAFLPIRLGSNVRLRVGTQEVSARVRALQTELSGERLSGVGAGQIVRIQLVVEGTNGLNTTDSCTRLEVLDSITPDKLALGLVLGPWRQRNGAVIWLTGLSGAGKTTLAQAVASRLRVKGIPAALLDGDAVRNHLSSGLGYTREDRDENICRIAFAASAIEGQGSIVLVSAISPYRAAREHARQRAKTFIEVYVNAPIEVCEARDVKGLYRRARSGEILEMAGLTSPYEPPAGPDVECQTDNENVEVSTNKILRALSTRGIICI